MPTNPFPGLRPFRAEESSLFTGRSAISERIKAYLRLSRITLLFARSGVGKSSFLQCRLIPWIKTESSVDYVNEWGADAPQILIKARLDALLKRSSGSEPPILVLDQFEDVFKSPQHQDRESLWDALADIINNVQSNPAHLLVSIREEWLGVWQESEDYLPDALNSLVRLRPLSDGEVITAITQPAATEGSITFSPELAKLLQKELKRPSPYGNHQYSVEPGLLQLVCRRLWSAANTRGLSVIDEVLYNELGGTDTIIREFVWNELGSAGMSDKEIPDPDRPKPAFRSSNDRVLWAGLTRHLIVAHGVKSIVSAEQLARIVTFPDLGLAGRAVAEVEIAPTSISYLDQAPEKRYPAPRDILEWIERVLESAVEAGFMKRQRAFHESSKAIPIYELSHDALADVLQVFKIEFEVWVQAKVFKLYGVIIGGVLVLPLLIYIIINATLDGVISFAGVILQAGVMLALYVGVFWVFSKILNFLGQLIVHPIYRRLSRGRVPLERMRRRR